jgi:hypothetical protein
MLSKIITELQKIGVKIEENVNNPEFSEFIITHKASVIGYLTKVENKKQVIRFSAYSDRGENNPFYPKTEEQFNSLIEGFQIAYSNDFVWFSNPNIHISGYECPPMEETKSLIDSISTFCDERFPIYSTHKISVTDIVKIEVKENDLHKEDFQFLEDCFDEDGNITLSGYDIINDIMDKKSNERHIEELSNEIYHLIELFGTYVENRNQEWISENWSNLPQEKKEILMGFSDAEFDFITLKGQVIIKEARTEQTQLVNLFGVENILTTKDHFFLLKEEGVMESLNKNQIMEILAGRFRMYEENNFKGFVALPR